VITSSSALANADADSRHVQVKVVVVPRALVLHMLVLITNLCYERCLEVSIREIDPAGLRHLLLLLLLLLLLCIRRDSLLCALLAPCRLSCIQYQYVYSITGLSSISCSVAAAVPAASSKQR
jgi:hypothetical protein